MNDGPRLDEWRRLRARVKAEDRDDEPGIGGGSALAARWQHRWSKDLDIIVGSETEFARLTEAENPNLWREMRAAGATTPTENGVPPDARPASPRGAMPSEPPADPRRRPRRAGYPTPPRSPSPARSHHHGQLEHRRHHPRPVPRLRDRLREHRVAHTHDHLHWITRRCRSGCRGRAVAPGRRCGRCRGVGGGSRAGIERRPGRSGGSGRGLRPGGRRLVRRASRTRARCWTRTACRTTRSRRCGRA